MCLLAFVANGCSTHIRPRGTPVGEEPRVFRERVVHDGPERYASWFGDSDGRVLYFGLSPFWEALRQCESRGGTLCALGDLEHAGEHLIGRFDMEREAFLPPLRVRGSDHTARSSVWDVLVHSNERIYYTTAWDEFGSVRPDGSDVQHYDGAGLGLNELWEGPEGEIYATRYVGSIDGSKNAAGAVAVFGADGRHRREFAFPKAPDGSIICPKSLAVDPQTRDIWLTSDLFHADGAPAGHPAFRVAPSGVVLQRVAEPELAFVSFDPQGRGWFVDDAGGHWILRIIDPDGTVTRLDLGVHGAIDGLQDIKHAGGVTLLATWGLAVHVVRRSNGGQWEAIALRVPPLRDCPGDFALGYTAALSPRGTIYETVYCVVSVVRVASMTALSGTIGSPGSGRHGTAASRRPRAMWPRLPVAGAASGPTR